jgi:hypothetical protein
MWEKYGTARQATDGNIIRRMRFECWIAKATDRHSEYVILTAFPWQQWLRERALISRYMHIACLVLSYFKYILPHIHSRPRVSFRTLFAGFPCGSCPKIHFIYKSFLAGCVFSVHVFIS